MEDLVFPTLTRILPFLLVLFASPKESTELFSEDFNPLKPPEYVNFKKIAGWEAYVEGGPLLAYAADFKNSSSKSQCVRVVVFMGDEAVLDYVVAECDTPKDLTMGLIVRENTLRYYDAAVVHPEGDRYFVIIKRTTEEDNCIRTKYFVEKCNVECSSPAKKKIKSESTDCGDLDSSALPHMWLVSLKQDIGKFRPTSNKWDYIFNPWDPLGFVSREYMYKSTSFYFKQTKCFRLVAVTTYGRVIKIFKLSCGKITDVTSTDTTLQLGDVLYVTRSETTESTENTGTFAILYNQGIHCVEESIQVIAVKGRRLTLAVRNNIPTPDYTNIVSLDSNDKCNRLVTGTIEENTVEKEVIERIKHNPIKHTFLHDEALKYDPVGVPQYFNVGMEMGVRIQTYQPRPDYPRVNPGLRQIVSLFVKGLPLVPIILSDLPSRQLVIRENEIYYGNDLAFIVVDASKPSYQVYEKENQNPVSCERTTYELNENGILEEIKDYAKIYEGSGRKRPSIVDVRAKTTGEDFCKKLVKGTFIKKEATQYASALTDKMGVPKVLTKL